MSTQEVLQKLDEEIKQVELDFQAEQQELLDKIAQAEKRRDEKTLELSEKRNDIALKEKLKAFPAELVNNHKTCSICGAEMRPFSYVEGERVRKAWACQVGSLSQSHDFVVVT